MKSSKVRLAETRPINLFHLAMRRQLSAASKASGKKTFHPASAATYLFCIISQFS
jgi:hypothetical protein